MQPFELATFLTFISSYLVAASRAIFTPLDYRDAEIRFYQSGRPGGLELATFVLGGAAFAVMLAHFIFEHARLGEIVLYAQVSLFVLVLPFHFMPFLRKRMVSTLSRKSRVDYTHSGFKKIFIALVMVLLPVILQR